MYKRDYRGKRVKVTDEIRGKVIDLLLQEKDGLPKKHIADWYRSEVARILKLKDKDNPSLRSYEEMIRPLRKRLNIKNPLDRPWNIGLSMKYDIPADIVPILIKLNAIKKKRPLTIRRARWIAYLYPLLAPLLKASFPDYSERLQLWNLDMITAQYAKQEEVHEILSGGIPSFIDAPDTSTLDNNYFISGGLSHDTISTWPAPQKGVQL